MLGQSHLLLVALLTGFVSRIGCLQIPSEIANNNERADMKASSRTKVHPKASEYVNVKMMPKYVDAVPHRMNSSSFEQLNGTISGVTRHQNRTSATVMAVTTPSFEHFGAFLADVAIPSIWDKITRVSDTGCSSIHFQGIKGVDDVIPVVGNGTLDGTGIEGAGDQRVIPDGGTMNDWCFLMSVLFGAFCLEVLVLQKVEFGSFGHTMIIVGWFGVACAYSGVVYVMNGTKEFELWWVGYLLDWMLNFDNLFVFHVVLRNFKTPARLQPKALAYWIFGGIAFRLVFYVALADAFNMMRWFQFACAFFLLYSAKETLEDEDEDIEVEGMAATRALNWCLAGRLDQHYDEEGYSLFTRSAEDGKLRANFAGACDCYSVVCGSNLCSG